MRPDHDVDYGAACLKRLNDDIDRMLNFFTSPAGFEDFEKHLEEFHAFVRSLHRGNKLPRKALIYRPGADGRPGTFGDERYY